MYNSAATDENGAFTIINDLSHDENQFLQRQINSKQISQTNFDSTSEIIQQLQDVLKFYLQDIKQEKNTQYDCVRQLTTRLVDIIRPTYSVNEEKMNQLDILFEEISNIDQKRFHNQTEKNKQLQNEIHQLKTLLVTSTNENENSMTKICRINSMFDDKLCSLIEDDTTKLYNLIKQQQERIEELVQLLSEIENRPPRTVSSTGKSQSTFFKSGSNINEPDGSIKQNQILQSTRICPQCQAIFNLLSMNEQQFNQHIEAHRYKRK